MRQNQPVKKLIFAVITAAIVLSGCGGPATTSSEFVSSTAVASTPADSSAALCSTTENKPVLPSPVSGSYNGQTVTMQYTVVTDYIWPTDNLQPGYYMNGSAHFYYYGILGEEEVLKGGTYIDKTGRMICDPIYELVTPFNSEGLALVEKEVDGPWTYLDTNGSEKGICDDPQFTWIADSKDDNGFVNSLKITYQNEDAPDNSINIVNEDGGIVAKFDRIGNFYNGLAPFILNKKLGFIDDKANIVIAASFPVNTFFYDQLIFNEDLLLVNTEGRIGIVEIIRS